ncbi:MAG: acylphosphatase [Reichenbachiella sp.]
MSNIISQSILVKGKVQGVFFRASTLVEAEKLSLTGLVKNQPDGNVYIEVYGEEPKILDFIAWCQEGPQFARVDAVTVEDIEFKEMKKFVIAY